MSVAPGDILSGKYSVVRVIGEGGMGLVVAARHIELGHMVAIKCLHASSLGHEGAVLRFEREARAAAALTSEHVARVIDVGRFEDGSPYMVMEFLEGEDLYSMLRTHGALSIGDTLRYMCHAAEGLGDAHHAGIIHRDVKPSNLFATRRKNGSIVVKVLDFGIAKSIESSGERGLTSTQALLGSPQYMSPEQVREVKTLDQRTDIWALGVTTFECLTGKRPFDAPSMVELCIAILNEPPPSIRSLRNDVPPELEAIVFKCLEKDPANRYADMAQVQSALTLLVTQISGESSSVLSRLPGILLSADAGMLDATVMVDQGSAAAPTPPSRPKTLRSLAPGAHTLTTPPPRRLVAVGAAVGALVLGLAIFFSRTKHEEDATPAPVFVAPESPAAIAPTSPLPVPVPVPLPRHAAAIPEPTGPTAAEVAGPSSAMAAADAAVGRLALPSALALRSSQEKASSLPQKVKAERPDPAPLPHVPASKARGLEMTIE